MTLIDNIKPPLLALFIGIALVLTSRPLATGECRTLTVAEGRLWCVDADFEAVKGVAGGTVAGPACKQVVRGGTVHFEAAVITFHPGVVSRATLVAMFPRSGGPTDADGQFCNRGDDYLAAIFVSDAGEKAIVPREMARAQAVPGQKIMTPVLRLTTFYPAGAHHQDFSGATGWF